MDDKRIYFIFSISLFLVLLDQLTKKLIARYIQLHQSIPLIRNLLHITYIQNTGAGFGIFKGWNSVLIFISLIIIGIISFYFGKVVKEKKTHIPVALILGGAVGNLIDRIFLGYVIDFIDFRIWPAFNIADSCITIGALWLIVYFWRE